MALCTLLPACSQQQEGIVFRYGHSQPRQAPRSQSMLFFEEELERRTGGRIRVENYFSATLGSERELMDMVATGVLQGTRGGLFADANPRYVLFMLPFLVENWEQALKLVNSDLTRNINEGARQNGFYVPATGISQGFRAHTNNVRPIRLPADLKGMKMRVPPQEVYLLTAMAFGASPHEMPASEIYSALKTGVLDGQDNPPSNIWDYNIFEVQKYMTITHYATGPDPLIVDLEWYEALPQDLRRIFDEVSVEAIAYSDAINQESETDYVSRLREKLEVATLAADEVAEFRKLVVPVYEHFVDAGVLSWDDINMARDIAAGSQASP